MTVSFYRPPCHYHFNVLQISVYCCCTVEGIEKGSSYRELEKNSQAQGKNSFYCIVNILITFNPLYRKRWRLNILPQFLSNITQPITHKVIFWGGEIRPCNSNIAYPRFEVYKTFLCVFMSNFMVFIC